MSSSLQWIGGKVKTPVFRFGGGGIPTRKGTKEINSLIASVPFSSSHFKAGATDYREPLLTWFLHKVPNLKPQELSALGLSEQSSLQQMAERIKSLNVHECMYKTHDVSGEFIMGAPFYRRNEWT